MRHGENEITDRSMSNVEDISRISYVLNNYDDVLALDSMSVWYRFANGKLAPPIRFDKKINGTYYVIEAITDTSRNQNYAIYSYIEKNKIKKEGFQASMTNDINIVGRDTAKPLVESPSINSIPQNINNGQG